MPYSLAAPWIEVAAIKAGPEFSKVSKRGKVEEHRLSGEAVHQLLLHRAGQAGIKGSFDEPVIPHDLGAGIVTTAYRNGMPDERIMGPTRHRSLTTMRSYVRRAKLITTDPVAKLSL